MILATGDDALRANLMCYCGLSPRERPVESNQACTRFKVGCEVVKLSAVLFQVIIPGMSIT